MVPDSVFWEWKLGEVSLLMSAILVAFARPIYFSFRFLIYAAFSSVSSRRWMVRCCVRLWMWSNWDIGAAIFGMVGDKWSVYSGSGTAGLRQMQLDIGYDTASGSGGDKGSYTVHFPEASGGSIEEADEALHRSFSNINRIDKRRSYQHLFRSELAKAAEMENTRQLRKQARRK